MIVPWLNIDSERDSPPVSSYDTYDEAARDRLGQRTRKGLNEIVYHDRWSEQEPA